MAEDIRSAVVNGMLHSNPPDHTRLRRLVSSVFTARRIEALRPRVVAITEELLDGLDGRSEFDLVAEIALPQPLQVICELLGVPVEDRLAFHAWTTAYVDGPGMAEFPVEEITAFVTYLRELIEAKRARPDDAVLSALIQAHDEDDRLTGDELISVAALILAAGYETTASLISTGTWLLLRHPEHARRLRLRPREIPAAVEEILRYDGPAVTGFPGSRPNP